MNRLGSIFYQLLSRVRWLVRIKIFMDELEFRFFCYRQRIRLWMRQHGYAEHRRFHSYTIAIVCVKRTEYVDLATQNINSLHYFNNHHRFVLYLDKTCQDYFDHSKKNIHYPTLVETQKIRNNDDVPWTVSKIQTLITASGRGQVLTDADGIWRSDFSVEKKRTTFLVPAYRFSENDTESILIGKVLGHPEWLEYTHYVTGFLSLPKEHLTKGFVRDLRAIHSEILEGDAKELSIEEWKRMKRLSEEIAVSLAVQVHLSTRNITTLKKTDGPGDKKTLQSMYYGCRNDIIQ